MQKTVDNFFKIILKDFERWNNEGNFTSYILCFHSAFISVHTVQHHAVCYVQNSCLQSEFWDIIFIHMAVFIISIFDIVQTYMAENTSHRSFLFFPLR